MALFYTNKAYAERITFKALIIASKALNFTTEFVLESENTLEANKFL